MHSSSSNGGHGALMHSSSSNGGHGALMHSSSSGCLTSHSHQVAAAAGSSGAGLGCGSGAGASAYVTSTGTSGGADAAGEYGAPAAAAGSSAGGGSCAGVAHASMVELPVLVRCRLAGSFKCPTRPWVLQCLTLLEVLCSSNCAHCVQCLQ
jgi:hypothetical protein